VRLRRRTSTRRRHSRPPDRIPRPRGRRREQFGGACATLPRQPL